MLGTIGQIGAGLLGADLPADLRDLAYDLQHWNELVKNNPGQIALDTVGVLPLVGVIKYGDEAALIIKKADGTIEKVIKNSAQSLNLPDVKFTTAKLQHEYKHAIDFGVNGKWNKELGIKYQQAIQNHIDTAPEIYKSTYRGQEVYVHFNPETGIGTYVDMTGNYIGGWKFSDNQIAFHYNNGKRIK